MESKKSPFVLLQTHVQCNNLLDLWNGYSCSRGFIAAFDTPTYHATIYCIPILPRSNTCFPCKIHFPHHLHVLPLQPAPVHTYVVMACIIMDDNYIMLRIITQGEVMD